MDSIPIYYFLHDILFIQVNGIGDLICTHLTSPLSSTYSECIIITTTL